MISETIKTIKLSPVHQQQILLFLMSKQAAGMFIFTDRNMTADPCKIVNHHVGLPTFMYQHSCTTIHVSTFMYQHSGTNILVPTFWYQHSGTNILVPTFWYQHFGTKILVPTFLYLDYSHCHYYYY